MQLTLAGFPLLTIIFFTLLVRELRHGIRASSLAEEQKKKIYNGIIIFIVTWAVASSLWAISGMMSDFSKFPLNVVPVFAIPLITTLFFTFSKTTGQILDHMSTAGIIRLQSFRFFVELLLWSLFVQHAVGEQMTFEGRNFDVISGVTAPFIALYASRPNRSRTFLIIWNLICLGLLINIVTVAILSMPSPFRVFMNEPSNTIVTLFPGVFLPAFLVPLAYLLHFLSLRQLLRPVAR